MPANLDFVPVWALFLGTVFFVLVAIEAGYLLGGAAHVHSPDEKESPVSAMTGSVLGLTAFVLAFTFGIVANRFDVRKGLVLEEANAIGTASLRADFLPEPDRLEAKGLYKEYVELRVGFTQSGNLEAEHVKETLAESSRIQDRLWEVAVANARKDMNSDVAALYIESLNEVIDIHAKRVTLGIKARIPAVIWLVLYAITGLSMVGVGYQTGISGSKRSMARPILALSFALIIMLIAALDRPGSGFVGVSQQPLIDLHDSMAAITAKNPATAWGLA